MYWTELSYLSPCDEQLAPVQLMTGLRSAGRLNSIVAQTTEESGTLLMSFYETDYAIAK